LLISTQRDAPVARRFCDTYRQVAQALRITTTEGATLIQAKGMSVPDFRKAIIDNLKPDVSIKLIQSLVCGTYESKFNDLRLIPDSICRMPAPSA